jgi:RHS repeat-associated protein
MHKRDNQARPQVQVRAHARTGQADDALEQNLRFQGQYLDRDTGLHYNTFRFYDPDIGRFISPDPIGLNGGPHLQHYSPNPISWIDPLGLTTCKMSAADKRAMGKPPPGMINPHRHHLMREMAPKGWSKAERGPIYHVQNLAKKFGIDINRDPRNFTWAQNGGGAHTQRAAAAVRDRLVPAARQGLAAFEAELAKLRIEMSQGKFW